MSLQYFLHIKIDASNSPCAYNVFNHHKFPHRFLFMVCNYLHRYDSRNDRKYITTKMNRGGVDALSNSSYINDSNGNRFTFDCSEINFFSYYGKTFFSGDIRLNYKNYLHVVAVILLLFGTVGNLVTITTICVLSRLHKPTFAMLACLALEDLIGLLVIFVYYWTEATTLITVCGDSSSGRYGISLFMGMLFMAVNNSSFHISTLMCIRYHIIVHPFRSKERLTCRLVGMTSVTCWAISVILGTVVGILVIKALKYLFIFMCVDIGLVIIMPPILMTVLHCLKVRALNVSPTLSVNVSRKMSCVLSWVLLVYIVTSLTFPFTLIAADRLSIFESVC